MGFYKKGQGATEYLVLLAVVLIIALVSIALLGFFPGLAIDAKMTQSNSYWRGEARPFQILEHSIAGTSTIMNVVLQNVDSTGTFTMTNLTINNVSYTTSTTFAPGEIKNVSFIFVGGAPGAIYELVNVSIAYTSPNSIASRQTGSKGLVGRFS